jgi:hypothetical protein
MWLEQQRKAWQTTSVYQCSYNTVNNFTEQSTNQPINKQNDLSTKQNTNQPIDRWTSKTINEPINYSVNKITTQPTNPSVFCQLVNNRFWPRDYEAYKHCFGLYISYKLMHKFPLFSQSVLAQPVYCTTTTTTHTEWRYHMLCTYNLTCWGWA